MLSDNACLLQIVLKDLNVVFASDIQALTSCGAIYQTISHVIPVKLSRGGVASMAVMLGWSVNVS